MKGKTLSTLQNCDGSSTCSAQQWLQRRVFGWHNPSRFWQTEWATVWSLGRRDLATLCSGTDVRLWNSSDVPPVESTAREYLNLDSMWDVRELVYSHYTSWTLGWSTPAALTPTAFALSNLRNTMVPGQMASSGHISPKYMNASQTDDQNDFS